MDSFVPAAVLAETQELWRAAEAMFSILHAPSNNVTSILSYCESAKQFLKLFVEHKSKGGG